MQKTFLDNLLIIHDNGINSQNDQRHQGQLDLHVGQGIVLLGNIIVALRLDDLFGIDGRKPRADRDAYIQYIER